MKKTIRKLLTLAATFMCVFLLLSINAYAATSGSCGANATWSFNSSTHTLTISGTGAINDYSSLTSLPWYSNRASIQKIVIGEGITKIGNKNFIGNMPVSSVSLPSTLTSIGDEAFYSCKNLAEVTIPAAVSSISATAFDYTPALTAFHVSPDNVTFYDDNGVLYQNNKTLLHYPEAKTNTSYTVLAGTKTIAKYAFSNSKLSDISLPNSLTTIGELAFWKTSLSSLTIPENVSEIGSQALDSPNITQVTFLNPGTTYVGTAANNNPSLFSQSQRITVRGYDLAKFYLRGSSFNKTMTLKDYLKNESTCDLVFSSLGTIGGSIGDSVSWLIQNSVLTISGSGAVTERPWSNYSGYFNSASVREGITALPDYVFYNSWNLTSATLPSSLVSLGAYAFASCSKLTTVLLPTSLSAIPANCFQSCGQLTNVTIPAAVTSIGDYAFDWCIALTSARIPASAKSIGDYAFSASGLTNIVIENGLETIGDYAFNSCHSLQALALPASVREIGRAAVTALPKLDAFTVDGNNPYFRAENGVLFNKAGTTLLAYPQGKTDAVYTVPASVTKINEGAFYSCALKEIDFVGSAPAIADDSFGFVTAVVCYPTADTSWATVINKSYGGTLSWYKTGGSVGNGFKWVLSADNQLIVSGSGAMPEFASNTIPWIDYQEQIIKVDILPGLTSVSSWAFQDCALLKQVSLPDGLASIGKYAFSGCKLLSSVTVPSGVTTIDSRAFSDCDALTGITLPATVTSLGTGVFFDCDNLQTASLSSGLTTLPKSTFYSCDRLYSVSGINNITKIEESAFDSCQALTSFTLPSNVYSVGNKAFHNCQSLRNVYGLESLFELGEDAFSYCYKLQKAVISSQLVTVPKSVYAYCTSITSVTLPQFIHTIDWSAFYGCTSLKTVTMDSQVETINPQAFYGCTALTSINLNGWLTYIHSGAFENCTALESIDLPGCVTTISSNAFKGCTGLKKIHARCSTPTSISDDAFPGVTATVYMHTYSGWDYKAQKDYGGTLTYVYHDYDYTHGVVTDPTCSSEGYTTYSCTACSSTIKSDYQSKLPHTATVDPAVAPTCTETGLSEGSHCSVCETVIVAQETVSARGHGDWTYSAEGAVLTATCGHEDCAHTETAEIRITSGTYIYDGKAKEPAGITYSDGFPDKTLVISYSDNIDAGTAGASITISGETAEATFTIERAVLTKPVFPQEGGTDKHYVFTGTQQSFIPDGFDEKTMTISGNTQTNANLTGYMVTVTPGENFKWNTEGDCAFTWIIAKAGVTDDQKLVSGELTAFRGSTTEIILPELPDGASFGDLRVDGVAGVSGTIREGKLALTVNTDIAKDISDFAVYVAVSGGPNYEDYTTTVDVNVAHKLIEMGTPTLNSDKITIPIRTELEAPRETRFSVVCYAANGRMLGLAMAVMTIDGSTTAVTLDCPANISESSVAVWKAMALDSAGFFPLAQPAEL